MNKSVVIFSVICLFLFFPSYIFLYKHLQNNFIFEPYFRQISDTKPYNKSHCPKLQKLKGILLAVNYNFPHYASIPLLQKFYEPIFGKVVFCGDSQYSQDVITINEHRGFLGYECVAAAIRLYPGYSGYLHINDDVILNWWNILKFDQKKIWTGSKIEYKTGHIFDELRLPSWHWWKTVHAAHLCENAFEQVIDYSRTKEGIKLKFPQLLKRYYKNTGDRKLCVHAWGDVFYIPKKYAKLYEKLSEIYRDNNVFLEVAVPGILAFLLTRRNQVNMDGLYLNEKYGYSPSYLSGEAFFETYTFDLTFSHPLKLNGQKQATTWNFVKNIIMAYGENIKRYCLK